MNPTFILTYLFDILNKIFIKGVFSMIEYLLSVIVISGTFKLWYKRITPFFVISRTGILYQSINQTARKAIQNHRCKYSNASLQTKIHAMARLFVVQLHTLLERLECNRTYRTKTHLKALFEKAEKQNKIHILQCTADRKRFLLIESWTLLGTKDTFSIFRSPKYRSKLYKQFYKITFTRVQ